MGQWDPSCATDPTPCSAKALTQVITTAFDSTVEGANCLPESNACAKEHQNLTIVAKCRTAFHENGGTAAKLQTSAGSKKHWDTSLIAWCTRLNSELGQPTHVLNDHSPNLGETASTWIPLSTDSTRFPCQAANNFRKVVFCRCRRLLERDTTGGEGWPPLVNFCTACNKACTKISTARNSTCTSNGSRHSMGSSEKRNTKAYLEPKWLRLEVWEGWEERENKPSAFNVNKILKSIWFGVSRVVRGSIDNDNLTKTKATSSVHIFLSTCQ